METASLKNFATWARRELITQVSARLTAVLAPASPERVENRRAVAILERDIATAGGGAKGKNAIADKVAYTWFNRIIALRFMDANGFTSIGVVSPTHGQQIGQPEVLADAKRGNIDPSVVTNKHTRNIITGLLDGTRPSAHAQGEAYSLLLAEYCRFWNRSMPFMFEREGDYTELLIPSNLLAADSILTRTATALTEDVCQEVEVIGWLYQFYISERKDEVFAGFKKAKKAGASEIPAATQLFTPHWIVRYLVENSVGRLWMLNHPDSLIVDQMDYYIAQVDEETDFLTINTPEELTVIDPACGSGHMLTYSFDLLYAIYEEEGYAPSEIPELILTHNLYGTEIDARAGSLAAFALTMKAREKQRTFFNKDITPNICVLEPISFRQDEIDALTSHEAGMVTEEVFWNQFAHADTLGSLIRPDSGQVTRVAAALDQTDASEDLLYEDAVRRARTLVRQADLLSRTYAVVVANPPYMGSKQMNPLLSQFMKDEYPTGKSDLMTAFMIRSQMLAKSDGTWAMINLPSWMSLKSFEELRYDLLRDQRICSMVHLGRGIFGSDFGTVAFVVANVRATSSARGIYRRLFEQHVDVRSVSTIETLFLNSDYNRFEVAQSDFVVIPGTPIVYWLSEKMRESFKRTPNAMSLLPFREGMSTSDNDRFVRVWHEVSMRRVSFESSSRADATHTNAMWFPFDQGGAFRKWWGNQETVVNWANDGEEIRGELPKPRINNPDYFFKPHLSISKITSGPPSFRIFPHGFALASVSKCAFFDSENSMYETCGLLNSDVVRGLLAATSPTLSFLASDLENLPLRENQSTEQQGGLERLQRLVETARHDWDCFETSWAFGANPLVALAREAS